MGSVDGLLEIRNQIPVSGLSACQSAGAYWIPQKFPSSSKANPSSHEPLILIELNDIDHTSGGFPLGLTRAPRSSGRGAVIPQPYAFTNAVVQPLRTAVMELRLVTESGGVSKGIRIGQYLLDRFTTLFTGDA